MKQFNTLLTKSLFSAALLAACSGGAQAQVFKKLAVDNVPTTHRGTPSFADINNDGLMDLYLCGQRCDSNNETIGEGDDAKTQHKVVPELGDWWVFGSMMVNQGDGKFAYPTLSFGDRMDSYGLPPSLWNTTRWFDLNNDGNLDFISMGCCDGWGFDINEENDKKYILLFQNGGSENGYKFMQVPNNGNIPQGQNEADNWGRGKSNFSFADYDHDGLKDILVQMYYKEKENGEDKVSCRKVVLMKNMGDGTFKEMNVFAPIPYDQNPNPEGIFSISSADENDPEAETIISPIKNIRPMSNGAVAFADFDGDGWEDIIVTGWADGNNGGPTITFYKNNQDGTFKEVRNDDLFKLGISNGDVAVADFNNDGYLDFAITGEDKDWHKVGDLYINNGTGDFTFTRTTADGGNGMCKANATMMKAIDIDHDGFVDLMYSGYDDTHGKFATILLKGSETGFAEESNLGEIETGGFNSGGFDIGHFTSPTSLDVVGTGWFGQYGTNTEIYTNSYDTDEVEMPEAPKDVKTSYENGKLKISWNGENNGNGVGYNVYVKNKATGKISMILPADTETGTLKVLQDLQTTVRSDNHENMSYTLNVPNADYEVGVAAVNPDAVSSKFTKADYVATGIKNLSANDINAKATIYNVAGQIIATNVSASDVNTLPSGIYIVKTGNKTAKVTVK